MRGSATRDSEGRWWARLENVLVTRPDNIGDVVVAGPVFRAFRSAIPDARLTLLASPAGAEAAPLLAPWLDDVIVRRVLWQDVHGRLAHDPGRELALVEEIRAREFDAAFFLTSFSQSPLPPAYVCYLARVPVRVGQATEHGGALLTHRVPPSPFEAHQAERNLHLLDAVGIPVADRRLAIRIPARARERASELVTEAGVADAFALVLPGASADARRYPPERFGAAARRLASAGLPVLVAGSECERSLADAAVAAADTAGVESLAGRTSVLELAALVERAAVVLANNSLGLHLADALARPVVVTYSGTDLEEQWAPRRSPAHVLRRATSCSPCYTFTCPYEKQCLDVPPQEVAAAALDLVAVARVGARTSLVEAR